MRLELASYELAKAKNFGIIPRSSGCRFDMTQLDVLDFQRADGCIALAFLLECRIQSHSGNLRKAAVVLSPFKSEGFTFIAVASPPSAAEFAAPQERDGVITFAESTPGKGIYVKHHTAGKMECNYDARSATIELLPSEGYQETSCLSAVLLVCLPHLDKVTFSLSVDVSAQVYAGGLFKRWRKAQTDRFSSETKVVKLSVLY